MFGLETLDVVIGLMFVYLLLALFATALNEYIAAVMNLRGKELAKGLGKLLDDIDEKDALKKAFAGVGPRVNAATASLTERFYNHRLIRPLATRRGWLFDVFSKEPRLPSYIPARTFALALLDVLGVDEKDASLERLIPAPAHPNQAVTDAQQALTTAEAAASGAANKEQAAKVVAAARVSLMKARLAQALADAEQALADAQAAHASAPKATRDQAAQAVAAARQALSKVQLAQVLGLLKLESPIELTEHLEILSGLPQADKLASALQVQVAGLVAGAQTQLQKLHDGVEVWFNNAMDRVSGAYKRTTQGWLFVLGLLIAACMNADTIDMWRRLEADDELRAAMVRRAEAAVAPMDSVVADSAAAAEPDSADADSAAAVRADSARRSLPPGGTTTTAPQPTDTTATDTTAAAPGVTPPPRDTSTRARGDTTEGDSAKLAAVRRARANYQAARTRLDSMELKLGWTTEQWVQARLLRKDTAGYPREGRWVRPIITGLERVFAPKGYHADLFPFDTGPTWFKLIGLLLTALAISLGAPFWFDLLNKVISIRAAGRSPEEKPKSPEGGPKRIAERAPK
ncbi:MAG TPA: hypothetical protein VFT45_08045 [Longimicrobium sp.]|nr:hypothetical protein [Longimicrobium sp.]